MDVTGPPIETRDTVVTKISADDHSMYPAFDAGEKIVTYPPGVISPGDDVLITMRDGRQLVRRLVRQDDGAVVAAHFNPRAEVELPTDSIAAIELVLRTVHFARGVERRDAVGEAPKKRA